MNQGAHELAELLRDFGGRADVVNEWLRCPSDIAKVLLQCDVLCF